MEQTKQNRVRIVVDSTADLGKDALQQLTVVPLTVRFGDEEFIDGVTIDHRTFYEKMQNCAELPTTSQVTPAAFSECFEKIAAAGETAVVITISSRLSGTFQSAMLAASDYPENVFVVDSRNATIGMGVLVAYALRLANEGSSAAEIFERLIAVRDKIVLVAMVDTLEYLKKGGRLSSTEAFVGSMLSIKPIIAIDDGEVKTRGKVRGSRQASEFLVREIEKAGGIDPEMPLLFGYTGLDASACEKFVADHVQLWNGAVESQTIAAIGSVIGVHAGPGAYAVAFFRQENE